MKLRICTSHSFSWQVYSNQRENCSIKVWSLQTTWMLGNDLPSPTSPPNLKSPNSLLQSQKFVLRLILTGVCTHVEAIWCLHRNVMNINYNIHEFRIAMQSSFFFSPQASAMASKRLGNENHVRHHFKFAAPQAAERLDEISDAM